MALNNKLIISQQNFVYIIDQNQILFCQSESCYTTIYLSDGKSHMMVRSLSKVAKEDLNGNDFLRVNQSFLVNRNFILRIDKKNKLLNLLNNHAIPFTVSIKELMILLHKEAS